MKNYNTPTIEGIIKQVVFENETNYRDKLKTIGNDFEKMVSEKDNFIKTVRDSIFNKIHQYTEPEIQKKALSIFEEYRR